MEVSWPFISADGTKVAFTICCYETYVIDMDGGLPQRIDDHFGGAHFSPDQNLLIMTSLVEGKHNRRQKPLAVKDSRRPKRKDIRGAFFSRARSVASGSPRTR